MKICKKCNIEYSDDKKFCKLCGSPLSQDYNIDPKKLAKKSVYEDRLKTDPLNIEILHEYAQFLFNNQLFQNSVSTLLKILAINESDEFAKELLYSSYLKLKMYREAQEIGELLLEDRSTDLSFIEGLAANSLQLGNRDKAYEYYEAILKLDPANPKALYHKAIGLLEKNEIENAINILNQKYEEGNRDRIVSIYAGIDKYFSDDYDKAIEILTSCFLDNDTTLSDVHSQRGLIYLIYCLCKSKHQIDKIDEWFSLLDFHSIKRFQLSTDSIMLAKATDEVITIYLEPLQNLTSYKIHYSINLYLNKPTIYCTEASSSYIAKIWYKIADIQESMGLLKDAQISFKKATELNPDNTDYIKRLNEIIALGAILEKQQKRKVFTIATSLILLVILIVISVNLYNRHKENKLWKTAQQQNTFVSYQRYLRQYPENRFSAQAIQLQEDALWQEAKQENTIESYDEYLKKYEYNDGKYISEAKEYKKNTFDWTKTRLLKENLLAKLDPSKNNDEAVLKFLDDYDNLIGEFNSVLRDFSIYDSLSSLAYAKDGIIYESALKFKKKIEDNGFKLTPKEGNMYISRSTAYIKSGAFELLDSTSIEFLNLLCNEIELDVYIPGRKRTHGKNLVRMAFLWGSFLEMSNVLGYNKIAISSVYNHYLPYIYKGIDNMQSWKNGEKRGEYFYSEEYFSSMMEIIETHPNSIVAKEFKEFTDLLVTEKFKKTAKMDAFLEDKLILFRQTASET